MQSIAQDELLRVYTDFSYVSQDNRKRFVIIIKSLLENTENPLYRLILKKFEIVKDIQASDFCLLPLPWKYYQNKSMKGYFEEIAEFAAQNNRFLFVIADGDYEPVLPVKNVILFHPGPKQSLRRRNPYTYALPAFWPDYHRLYFGEEPKYREKRKRPLVGFCGQGASTPYKLIYYTLRNLANNLRYNLHAYDFVPEPIIPSTILRSRILKHLHASTLIDDSFIVRDRYRAGIRSKKERQDPFHPTKVEFVQNIYNSDYTVCVRGGGNFSVRFYETLSLGRIPIFVNTDCVLPYDFALNWKDYCCWIEQHEIPYIAEKVADFHNNLSPDDFVDRQKACRHVWENWVSQEGFYRNFHRHLEFIHQQSNLISPR